MCLYTYFGLQDLKKIMALIMLSRVTSNICNAIYGAASLGASAGYWSFDKLITTPLRIFYFVGPVWKNAPHSEICYMLTGVTADRWTKDSVHAMECQELLERRFASWDATILTSAYFAVLTFTALQLMCRCCFVRPIIRDIGLLGGGR